MASEDQGRTLFTSLTLKPQLKEFQILLVSRKSFIHESDKVVTEKKKHSKKRQA